MIKSFKHKGLRQYFERGLTGGIQAPHAKKTRTRLAVIDAADCVEDIDRPGYFLHALSGKRAEVWSIRISGNWRITFEFQEGHAYMVNYKDYR